MVLDDSAANGEPQAGTLAGRFGGKKGLEDMPLQFERNALACVGHREGDTGSQGVKLRADCDLVRWEGARST